MMFHKVICIPIMTALRILHFYDLYVHFSTPLSSHIQIPQKKVPKTLLLQLTTFGHHPEHIIFSTFKGLFSHKGPLQDGQNRFFLFPPSSAYKGSKVGNILNFLTQRQYYLHGQHPKHTFGNFYDVTNPSSQPPHNQFSPK